MRLPSGCRNFVCSGERNRASRVLQNYGFQASVDQAIAARFGLAIGIVADAGCVGTDVTSARHGSPAVSLIKTLIEYRVSPGLARNRLPWFRGFRPTPVARHPGTLEVS
jgi:hypothetical protein